MKHLKLLLFFIVLSAVKLKYWSDSHRGQKAFESSVLFFGTAHCASKNGLKTELGTVICTWHWPLLNGHPSLFPPHTLFLFSLSLAQFLFLPFRWSLLVLISCALLSRFCCLCAIFTFQKKKHKQKSERTTQEDEEEDGEERNKRPSS